MSKILLISDLGHDSNSNRGAECCDKVIHDGLKCDFLTCGEFNQNHLDYDRYLVSNFMSLSEESKDFLSGKEYYLVIHDNPLCPSRNPGNYENFVIPPDHLINFEFVQKAARRWTQSKFHQKMFTVNGVETENLGGSLWEDKTLDFITSLGDKRKNGKAAVIADPYKNTNVSIKLCQDLQLDWEALPRMPYLAFLNKLSDYSLYVFIPGIVESFCRILAEAKMMNVVALTNYYSGITSEEIYKLNGRELAAELVGIRDKFLEELKK